MNKLKIRLLLSDHRRRPHKPKIWHLYYYKHAHIYHGEKYV